MPERAAKKRLDVVLQNRCLASSRTKAQALILARVVTVDGKTISKAGTLISDESAVRIIKPQPFVSRGGEKLEGALADFNIHPRNLVCIDVGASTGGFTDCLLQKGAKKVYAVDVGTAQLIDSIRNDPRVVSFEKTHILDLDPAVLDPKPVFAVIDVSFISLKKVLPKVKMLLPEWSTSEATIYQQGMILALVKPQFEVGPKFLKKGVVRETEIQKKAVREIIEYAENLGLQCIGEKPSKLKGPKGNQEYFVLLKK